MTEEVKALADGIVSADDPVTLAELLRRLLATTVPERLVLRYHPLGFVDLPLDTKPVDVSRRLPTRATVHIWHPAVSRAEAEPPICHAHGWHLTSTVLSGSVGNQAYDVQLAADGNLCLYEILYTGDTSVSRRTDVTCTATPVAAVFHRAGATYQIAADAYHASVLDGDELVITAMASDNMRPAPALAIRPRSMPGELRYDRQPLPDYEKKVVIGDMLAVLNR